MGNFDAKWNAYEQAMKANNYFGVQGEARAEQMGRYAEGLQYDEIKAQKKAEGRAFGREIAQERAQKAALTAKEQADLARGLGGNATPADFTTYYGNVDELRAKAPTGNIAPEAQPATEAPKTSGKSKVTEKMRVGTPKTGYKYYLVDNEGNTYEISKKEYNQARKGKKFDFSGHKPIDPEARVPKKVQVAVDKAKTKATPEGQKPATPEAPKPDTPEAPKPATPEAPKPATPEAPKPATPEAPKPATPEAPKPATPEAPKPATPEAPKPATPEAPKPATPEAPKPATPEAPKPATPEAPKPATPEAKTPGKFGKFLKSSKGKMAIAGAAIAAIGLGVAYLAGKDDKDKETTAQTEVPVTTETPENGTTVAQDSTQTATPAPVATPGNETPATQDSISVATPAPSQTEEANKPDKAGETKPTTTETEDEDEPEQTAVRQKIAYTVKSGDNVWNIVKRELKLTSNADILRETLRVMSENDLHFEADQYTCIIKPGQVINI